MSSWFASSRKLRGAWDRVWLAVLWRYGTHSLMVLITLITERIPAPSLSDRVVSIVPYVPVIARYNFFLWILCFLPVALWFWRIDRDRFVVYLYAGGILNLLRTVTVTVTSLGPVRGPDINAGAPMDQILTNWLAIINPVSALMDAAPNMHLTKDLFFSGHTATTFMLWLYCRRYPKISWVAFAAHIAIIGVVYMSHIHYTIDIIGAWAITFSVYVLVEHRDVIVRGGRPATQHNNA